MRDECYQAKLWLNRNFDSLKKLKADMDMLAVLENLLGSGVARYENDGTSSGDSDAARHKHEDMLLEYSERRADVESEKMKLAADLLKTRRAIDSLENDEFKTVAIERYICCKKWDDIAKAMHICRAQAFRVHDKMIEKMVAILKEGGEI